MSKVVLIVADEHLDPGTPVYLNAAGNLARWSPQVGGEPIGVMPEPGEVGPPEHAEVIFGVISKEKSHG